MSGRYKVPYIVGNTAIRDHQMWPTVEDSLFSTILAGGSVPPITENSFAIRGISRDQLLALAWRVSEWKFSGTWGILVNTFAEPGHVFTGSVSVDNSFVNSPPAKAFFATVQNDLTTFHMPVVDEKRLVWENFGPKHFSPKQYSHDFDQTCHSFGLRYSDTNQHSIVSDGLVTNTYDDGSFDIRMFRDWLTTFNFGASRGSDMVRYHPATVIPLSPPTFDVFFVVTAANGGPAAYCALVTDSGLTPNGTLTIDPVIAPPITVDVCVLPVSNPGSSNEEISSYCGIVITANAFFEYSNGNGDPVYDATTGAQINDPFA